MHILYSVEEQGVAGQPRYTLCPTQITSVAFTPWRVSICDWQRGREWDREWAYQGGNQRTSVRVLLNSHVLWALCVSYYTMCIIAWPTMLPGFLCKLYHRVGQLLEFGCNCKLWHILLYIFNVTLCVTVAHHTAVLVLLVIPTLTDAHIRLCWMDQ